MERPFIRTDHGGYGRLNGRCEHETVKHVIGEYVRSMASTNGAESFWAMMRRGYHGVDHHVDPCLQREVQEFAGRHGFRHLGTVDQLCPVVAGFSGKRLVRWELIDK